MEILFGLLEVGIVYVIAAVLIVVLLFLGHYLLNFSRSFTKMLDRRCDNCERRKKEMPVKVERRKYPRRKEI